MNYSRERAAISGLITYSTTGAACHVDFDILAPYVLESVPKFGICVPDDVDAGIEAGCPSVPDNR